MQKKILLLAGLAFLYAAPALASISPADQASTQESRFREERMTEKPSLEEERTPAVIEDRAEQKAPEVSGDTTKIPLQEIKFVGNYSIPDSELKPIVQELIGRQPTLGEIQDAVSRVKKYYRQKGYVATYAYVPPQQIEGGTLSIDVIEGRLGELRIEGAKFYETAWLRRQFAIRAGDVLTYDAIRKDLNRLNKMPDLKARLSLEAGKEIGTANALVTVEDQYPVHLSMDLNNSGTKNTGLNRWGTSVRHNNVTGHMDSLSLTTQLANGTRAIGGGYEAPVPMLGDQTRAGYLFSHADVDIGGTFKALRAEGKATTHSFYATRPLWENASTSVSGTAAFDFKHVRNKLLGQVSGKDDLRIARFESAVEHDGGRYKAFLNGGLHVGIPDILGGMDDVSLTASRPNTGGEFFAARAQGSYFRRLGSDYLLMVRGTAQGTPDSLPSSEQFRLGGARTVRGYQESDSSTDYGAHVSTEFYYPMFVIPADWKAPTGQNLREIIQGFVFLDGGYGALRSPAVGESKHKALAGVGFGFRVYLGKNFYARTEWGFPIADQPTDNRDHAFYFSVGYEFF